MTATIELEPGYVGNLDSSQEQKLHQFWRILIQSWDASIPSPDPARKSSISSNVPDKSHRRFFSFGRSQAQPTEEEISAIPANLHDTLKSLDAGAADLKSIGSLLIKLPGDQVRSAFLVILKQDHPDALLLRFLRAEKWNVPKAWIKFVSSLNWRVNEYMVDEEVMLKGEEHNLEKSRRETDSTDKKDGEGYVLQLNTGKGYFHGADKFGRPICVVRVRIHNPSEQTQKGLFDYIIHCIESVRFLQVPPVESMAIVFDLTSFSLSNWDFPPVKFIIDSFQENYPESLGAMIFYNAPWIFSGFWKIIHGILDPVVASKVHFISGAKELEELVPKSQILKELGGEEEWEYEYIEPTPGENDRLKDTATRDDILAKRKLLGDELFNVTSELISKSDTQSPDSADSVQSRRAEVIRKLSENYWVLDPGGTIDFYPARAPTQVNEKPEIAEKAVDDAQVPTIVA
ncbi:hypothetical protein N7462_007297 [Penicillium macrosclerotiorum]|uniref:uncharacterized protein n=1 Tax=Penicillium macrosclerotiorum TaxID=303699 RepID=UPI002547BBE7|nr:uncharacterized protein N7462_007297 [Penicillium macrosclerotiorum]KAJ5679053.1 hypothetical protein N7462_007297 [Penicillium macrosclerotiorum]